MINGYLAYSGPMDALEIVDKKIVSHGGWM